jgi:hypothetical protein
MKPGKRTVSFLVKTKSTKRIITCFAFFIFAATSKAQSPQALTGYIFDGTQQPLEMVTIALLNPNDSSLVHFGITNKTGLFELKGIPTGTYIFQGAYIGHQTLMFPIQVGASGTNPKLDTLTMQQETNILSEIIIEGQRIPIIINRDTISYNTGSFNVRSDESVEDLLRRLPGIEVDAKGQVKAQGEEVRKVLVDGKEFFGGNVQLVTQSLPADAVKNIKVYDRKSEDAMFTGVEDGQREKTIDLELKEDRKVGVFGDLEAGIGTEERYRAKGSLHAFSPTTRFSVLSNNNNLNQFGFGWNDMMAMAGNQGGYGSISISGDANSMIPLSFMAPNEGLFSSSTSGFNLNYDPNQKHRFNANYFLTYYDHQLINNIQSQEFNNTAAIDFEEQSRHRNLQLQHRAYMEYRWDMDSNNRFELKGSLNTTDNNNRHRFAVNGATNEGVSVQDGTRFDNRQNEIIEGRGTLSYIHNFSKPKRNLKVNGQVQVNDEVTLRDYEASNRFPLAGMQDFLSQTRVDGMLRNAQSVRIDFTEPLGKVHQIQTYVYFRNNLVTQRRDVTDLLGGGLVDSLSPKNDMLNREYTSSVGYTLDLNETQNYSISTRLSLSHYEWGLTDLSGIGSFDTRSRSYLRPEVWFQYNQQGRRIYINANRFVRLPDVFQLIDVPDLLNPLNITRGNPNLNPEVRNSFSARMYRFKPGTGNSWSAQGSASLTENPFVFAQDIDADFRRISQTINSPDPNYNFQTSASNRTLIAPVKTFISLEVSYNHNVFNAPVNGINNRQISNTYSGEIEFSNSKKKKIDVDVSYNYSITQAAYSVFEDLNQSFTTQTAGVDLIYHPNKQLTFRASFDYMHVSEENFAGAFSVPLLNANLSYQLKSNKNWTFKLNAFDLLNQNLNIMRSANANLIQQRETNMLTRYVLVSVLYKFSRQ